MTAHQVRVIVSVLVVAGIIYLYYEAIQFVHRVMGGP